MKDDFIKEGMWSTSIDFKEEIYGRLIYSKISGLLLELRGKFDIHKIQNVRHITLYGSVEQFTTKITLLGCDPIHWGNSFIDLKVNACLIGDFVDVSDGLKIKTAHFEYFGLQDFLGKSGFNKDKDDKFDVSVNYKYQIGSEVKFDDVNITFQNWLYQQFQNDYGKTGNKKILFKEYVQIKFDYKAHRDLSTMLSDSSLLTYLLSLLSNNVIFPLSVKFTLDSGRKVDYLYQNPYFIKDYNNDDHCIVPLENADLSSIVPELFKTRDLITTFVNYKRAADLYHNHFDENRFLDSLVVLETFHRTFKDNTIDSDLEVTVKRLINSGLIPNDQKKYFESIHLREKPNYQKYLELYLTIGKQCQDRISLDIKKYCRFLTDTRNAYTHNERNRSNLLRDEHMSNATENNEALIKYLLLMKLGIEQSILDKNFENEFRRVDSK